VRSCPNCKMAARVYGKNAVRAKTSQRSSRRPESKIRGHCESCYPSLRFSCLMTRPTDSRCSWSIWSFVDFR
jgi:hypothetical protein